MKIGIYGLGRFGRFWGKTLSRDFDVYGFNRSAVDEPPEGITLVSEEELFSCDTVFLCVSISAIEAVATRIVPFLQEGITVADTCSVKVYPARIMDEIFPASVNVLGTHPMFGPDSGRNGVRGLPLVFSPVRGERETFVSWREIFLKMGLDVIEISPEEHDREAAFTQGITHFIGRVLERLDLKESRIATEGYKALLEIVEQTCNDPMQLFMDLQHFNRHTHEMRNLLSRSIEETMQMLKSADPVGDGF